MPIKFLSTIKRSIKNRQYDQARISFVEQLTGSSEQTIPGYIDEIHNDAEFIELLRNQLQLNSIYQPSPKDFMLFDPGGSMFFYCVLLYAFVRIYKPSVLVETGGTPGKTSAFFLKAMERNGEGQLYTIDFPPTAIKPAKELPVSKTHHFLPKGKGSGWIVPDSLKHRHHLIVGKSADHLPQLLEELGQIDVFLHDGGHEYDNMMWEYEIVWPHLKQGGILLSDDIAHNTAWQDFCKKEGMQSAELINLGATLKP